MDAQQSSVSRLACGGLLPLANRRQGLASTGLRLFCACHFCEAQCSGRAETPLCCGAAQKRCSVQSAASFPGVKQ